VPGLSAVMSATIIPMVPRLSTSVRM
jgi:hypothetical protein